MATYDFRWGSSSRNSTMASTTSRLRTSSRMARPTRSIAPAQHQVVENGHLREQLDVLEGAGDAQVCDAMRLQADQVLAAEADRARVGLVEPRDAVEDGRLAGSVGADHGEDLAVVDREADTLDGLDRLEGELEVLDLEDGVVAPGARQHLIEQTGSHESHLVLRR